MISIYSDRSILIFCLITAAVIGAVFGSFLNCAAFRTVRGESFLKGRSVCPSCGHTLGAPDLIPVFSWLLLKGRCRYCRTRISARYPLTEAGFALVTVLFLLRFDLSFLCLRNWLLLCCLFYLSLTDAEKLIIPDKCLLAAGLIFLVFIPLVPLSLKQAGFQLLNGFLFAGAVLLLSLLMDRLLKKESLGGGDIKLIFILGLYLRPMVMLLSLLAACLAGLLGIVIGKGRIRNDLGQFPFGPFLAGAAVLMLLVGDPLADWYLGLF